MSEEQLVKALRQAISLGGLRIDCDSIHVGANHGDWEDCLVFFELTKFMKMEVTA